MKTEINVKKIKQEREIGSVWVVGLLLEGRSRKDIFGYLQFFTICDKLLYFLYLYLQ